jgi:large subunit ribosomal protein L13
MNREKKARIRDSFGKEEAKAAKLQQAPVKHTIINADGLILGRMAAFAAKRALLGEKVDVVNCEKAIISGSRTQVFEHYMNKFARGAPLLGPYYPRFSDRLVRRVIRGMLPYKKPKGKEAFGRVMCYRGVPETLNTGFATIKGAEASKLPNLKYVSLGEITKLMGAK